jgi:hypothetical protein
MIVIENQNENLGQPSDLVDQPDEMGLLEERSGQFKGIPACLADALISSLKRCGKVDGESPRIVVAIVQGDPGNLGRWGCACFQA